MRLPILSQFSLLFFFLFCTITSIGQNSFQAKILDARTQAPLQGATIFMVNSNQGATSNEEGYVILEDIPNGNQNFQVSFISYETFDIQMSYPAFQEGPMIILLIQKESDFDEIIIEATRANRIVANTPTRTEVLTEEIDEAASMEPSKIAHLITHSTGIQVQTTSAASNGAVVRIQGLNGRYTQILKDGFPLYGGFSGSLDVLQIPPLDLRQVEYIKGSASTLYGGGAIGGLINLLSKTPSKDETLLHINFSHIGSQDFNAFASRKFGKFGFSNLASLHIHTAYDADSDGFSDVPEVAKFNFNPKLFYYPNNRMTLMFGANISREERRGGDMDLIKNADFDSTNFYLDAQKSSRYTTQFKIDQRLSENNSWTIKNSISQFSRQLSINQNQFGSRAEFSGKQTNSFSEFNFNSNKEKQNLTLGANVYTDQFDEASGESLLKRDQQYFTLGAFVNHLWDIGDKFSLESGLRTDYATAKSNNTESDGESFILPKISALYHLNESISLRLGGGMGYRMPTIFNEEAEPLGYNAIQAIKFDNVTAERSIGGNFDFKYRTNFSSDNLLFTFNQMFFYNVITNPIQLLSTNDTSALPQWEYQNFGERLESKGFESQIKFTFGKFTWFFGYTYTDAQYYQNINGSLDGSTLLLTPKHSIKGDLLFVEDNKWRIGWDYEYKSSQLLIAGIETRDLFTTGIVVERTIDNFVIFLNAENFTDTRQTRYESVLSGPYNTPQFTQIWAPLDGFFFNAGLKIKL